MWLKLLLLTTLAQGADRTFDASAFKTDGEKPKVQKHVRKAPVQAAALPKPEVPNEVEVKRSKTRIRATTVLLGVEKNPKEIYNLLLSRGNSYYKLSRIARLNPDQNDSVKLETVEYLRKAKIDFTSLSKMPMNNVQSSNIDYMLALIAFDQNEYPLGKTLLIKALAENRTAPYASGVALYLADEYYFSDRLDEALKEYTDHLDIMSPKDKIRSKYRIAWIHLKKNQQPLAETEFIALAKTNAPDLHADILRDLAALAPILRKDEKILTLVDDDLRLKSKEQIEFLEEVIRNKEGDGKMDSNLLVKRLLLIETRPMERANLRISIAKGAMKKELTPEFEAAYHDLFKEIEGFKPEARANVSKELNDQLKGLTEALVMRLTNAFSELYHKKPKTPEEDRQLHSLAQRLEERLNFLDGNYKVKERIEIFKLWLDVCASEKDWNCVLKRVETIQTSPDLAPLKADAEREKLAALEEMNKSNPAAANRLRLIAELEHFIQDTKRDDWQSVAQRLSAFYVEDKNYAKAIPLIQKIDAQSKTEDSYYRLQLARFQDNRFEDVVKDKRPRPSERISQLMKESHLKIAQGAVKGGGQQFDQYESNLKDYLAMTTDPKKRLPLLKDYYARLEAKPDLPKLEKELMSQDFETRWSPDLEPFMRRLINTRFIEGTFADVLTLIGPLKQQKAEDLRFTAYLAEAASHPEKTPRLEGLTEERRSYVLGLLVLTDPSTIENNLKPHAISTRPGREMGLLAMKIRACNPPLSLSATQLDRLGDVAPEDLKPHPKTSIERAIASIKFAKVKVLGPKATAAMMATLEKVRKVRPQVIEGVKKMTPDVQFRVLTAAEELEKNAAEMLLTAPVPKGLNPQQTEEYMKGVKELASEFTNQASAYTAAEVKLKEHDKELAEKAKTPVSRPKSEASWPWPTGNADLERLHKNAATHPLIETLIVLDFMKSANKINEREYYLMREGVLLYNHQCQFMVDYVYNELKSNKQDALIEMWSKL